VSTYGSLIAFEEKRLHRLTIVSVGGKNRIAPFRFLAGMDDLAVEHQFGVQGRVTDDLGLVQT
jgi:hypothetical protein